MNGEKVKVPPRVLEGLEAVRRSGQAEMSDRPLVSYLAHKLGYPETADWIYWNKAEYSEGIVRGFSPEVDEGVAPRWIITATITVTARTQQQARTLLDKVLTSAPGVLEYGVDDVWKETSSTG